MTQLSEVPYEEPKFLKPLDWSVLVMLLVCMTIAMSGITWMWYLSIIMSSLSMAIVSYRVALEEGYRMAIEGLSSRCMHGNDPSTCKRCRKNMLERARYHAKKEEPIDDKEECSIASPRAYKGMKTRRDLNVVFSDRTVADKFLEELELQGTGDLGIPWEEASVRCNILLSFRMDKSKYGYDFWDEATQEKGNPHFDSVPEDVSLPDSYDTEEPVANHGYVHFRKAALMLKPEHREAYVNAVLKQYGEWRMVDMEFCDRTSKIVSSSFIWDDTDEGSDYWNGIYSGYFEKESRNN